MNTLLFRSENQTSENLPSVLKFWSVIKILQRLCFTYNLTATAKNSQTAIRVSVQHQDMCPQPGMSLLLQFPHYGLDYASGPNVGIALKMVLVWGKFMLVIILVCVFATDPHTDPQVQERPNSFLWTFLIQTFGSSWEINRFSGPKARIWRWFIKPKLTESLNRGHKCPPSSAFSSFLFYLRIYHTIARMSYHGPSSYLLPSENHGRC